MPYTGIQAELPVLLAEYAFRSRQDISDYLTLLAETDEYFDQLLTFEEERSRAGLFCSDSAVDHIVAVSYTHLESVWQTIPSVSAGPVHPNNNPSRFPLLPLLFYGLFLILIDKSYLPSVLRNRWDGRRQQRR